MEQYEIMVEGLHEAFARVPGLAVLDEDGNVINILDSEPLSLNTLPTLYTLHDHTELTQGNPVVSIYRSLHRLCHRRVDQELAERLARPWLDLIPKAIEQDPYLGGRLGLTLPGGEPNPVQGHASIVEVKSTIVVIGETLYLAQDYTSIVVCKRARLPRV